MPKHLLYLYIALTWFIIMAAPALAQNPPPCQLEDGAKCPYTAPNHVPNDRPYPRLYPDMAARQVPTYTLISITFDQPLNPDSIFGLTTHDQPITGTIHYNSASHMMIFQPSQPLEMNTIYTATFTPFITWSFTTVSLPDIKAATLAESMQIYFGDLHNHTSYSDGVGTPADAYLSAKANGLDFLAVTDHDFMLTETEWQTILQSAQAASVNGQFIGLRGFEFTHDDGHLNVFDTTNYVQFDNPRYDTLSEFYNWLLSQPTAIAQFNHPQRGFNFNNFSYNRAADHRIFLRELTTPEQFFLSLTNGWHVGNLMNSDTHQATWGCCPLMGVIAPNLTQADILAALRARRTFFVSPSDRNFTVVLQINNVWMGGALDNPSTLHVTVTAHDPDPNNRDLTLTLYENDQPIAQTVLPSSTDYEWKFDVAAKIGHYYFAAASKSTWSTYPAYSSPIWVAHRPIAIPEAPLTAWGGELVKLDGRRSTDEDGEALMYQWQQVGGTTVTLLGAETGQPTFIAPQINSLTQSVTFELTVFDPSGLSATKTISLAILSEQPLLNITLSGPMTTPPNQPITYTLTLQNNGLTEARNVVITNTLPQGATYLNGGVLLDQKTVQWTIPTLAAHGGLIQVTFAVTASQPIINDTYGVRCNNCAPVVGRVVIVTNGHQIHLPMVESTKLHESTHE